MAYSKREKLSFESHQVLVDIGQNVRRARLRRNINQAELAKRAGVGVRTLARLESGDGGGISLATMISLLETMDMLNDIAMIADPDRDERGKELESLSMRKRASRSEDDDLDTNF